MSARAFTLILLVHVALAAVFLSPGYLKPDSAATYSYLRSIALDGDLLFYNEWHGFGLVRDRVTLFKEVTPTGALANHWWIGTSILSAPFYATGHLLQIANGKALDGFSGAYAFALGWSVVLFGAATSFIAWKIMREMLQCSVRHTTASLALLWSGTPLFFYEFRFPLGTHLAGALCVGALLWFLLRIEKESSREIVLLAGLAFGLAVATRLQHFVLAPAALYALYRARRSWRDALMFAAASALPLATQGIAWSAIYGHPLGPLVSGSIQGATWMPFQHNALRTVLFTSYHGLFSWSPLLLFAVGGWIVMLLHRQHTRVAEICLLMFLGEWFANGFLDRYFWGGMSFGGRRFIDLAVPFAIGLAFALNRKTIAPMGAAVLWSIALTASAITGKLELAHDVSWDDLFAAATKVSVGELGAAIARTSAIMRAPGLTVSTLFACVVVFFIVRIALKTERRQLITLGASLSLVIVILLFAAVRTRSRAGDELRRFNIDVDASRALGPLFDARGLIQDEATFFRNRGDRRVENSLRDLAHINGEIERLESARESSRE